MLPTRYFAQERQKWRAVVESTRVRHELGQPILLGTRTINQSEVLADLFFAAGVRFEILNGKQTAEEAKIVAEAGRRGAITIATNLAGRGTDIQLEPGVAELGGLHVIATERNESERIDRQLIGRCARQGDPGSGQFFVSAEDSLITLHSPVLARQMKRLADDDGEIRIDLSAQVRAVQKQAERAGRLKRQSVADYDEWRMDLISKLS
jgi:preprotein translocase subunit SecA